MRKRKFKVGDAVILTSNVDLYHFPEYSSKKVVNAIKAATDVRYIVDKDWYGNYQFVRRQSNNGIKKDSIGIVVSVGNVFMLNAYSRWSTIKELLKNGIERNDIIDDRGSCNKFVNDKSTEYYVVFINNTFVAFKSGAKLMKVDNKEACYSSANISFELKLETNRKNIDDKRLQKEILDKISSLKKTMSDVAVSSVSVMFNDGTKSTLECDLSGNLKQTMADILPEHLKKKE